MISTISTLFCLPYILFDLIFYKDVAVALIHSNKYSNNSSLSSNESNSLKDSLKLLPLILLNIPHTIKFYLLFILHNKFRNHMSNFLCLKLYFNFEMFRQFKFFTKKSKSFKRTLSIGSKNKSSIDLQINAFKNKTKKCKFIFKTNCILLKESNQIDTLKLGRSLSDTSTNLIQKKNIEIDSRRQTHYKQISNRKKQIEKEKYPEI